MLLVSQNQEKIITVDTLPGLQCLKLERVADNLKSAETNGALKLQDATDAYAVCVLQEEKEISGISVSSSYYMVSVPIILAVYPSKERCKNVLTELCKAYEKDPVSTVFVFPGK